MGYDNEDVVGLGELLSIGGGLKAVLKYTGPVFVVTASNDDVFLPGRAVRDRLGVAAGDVGGLYQKSSNFSYSEPIGTGHIVDLHYTAQQSFATSYNFLAANGF